MECALPIGIEFYKKMVEKNFYYVDKTLLVKDILDSGTAVSLFTRPRRFGKTLALSMLRTFFEDERTQQGDKIDNTSYFVGKKIFDCEERYTQQMGKYPVINLSLKSAKQPNYDMAYQVMLDAVCREYERHLYVLKGEALLEEQKEKYRKIYQREASPSDYATSLSFLTECLHRYHDTKVVVLIDEYDVPLENAYYKGFYSEMIEFIRSLFESVLKTNESLEFAVITGCLRISRESIFTGLNNMEVISVLNEEYAEYFGFTSDEVERMLEFYDLTDKKEEIQSWYDGYQFGNSEVYNPWSVINYVKVAATSTKSYAKPYWTNTSSNSIVRDLVEQADLSTRRDRKSVV